MPLDGFVGVVRYAADPEYIRPFLPLLHVGTALGVGRGCSFGNGRYRLSLLDSPVGETEGSGE
jgi:CRISPR/Cas system endoribonuclease Cas6 (RAMP superfamily)